MDFLAANHVRIVGLCGQVHRAVIFAIARFFVYLDEMLPIRRFQ